jgi:hypothetical protein
MANAKQLNSLNFKTMKSKIKLNIIAIVLLSYSFCSAQQTHHIHTTGTQWLALHKQELSTTAYIFEGTIIKQSLKSGTELTCSIIKITKIYKGSPEIKIGTIKILTQQNPSDKDGWKGLSKGSTYVIFGKMDSDKFHSIAADNSLTISCIDYINIANNNTARWGGIVYNTTDSLYSFFKENGVAVQEEQK